MDSSKKCSKLGVKLLASVLSVITLCPGITPYVNAANSKTLRSGNYITRKVKNVGLRADLFIKRKYIELCSLIKNNPKTTIAVGTTVGLVIIGTISVVCYKSRKDKKGAEEPVTGEQKSEDSEAEQHGAGETEEPNPEKIVTGEPETKESKTGEQKSEDSKTEQQGAGESEEPNPEKIVTGEPETKESKTGEQKSEDSKTEQQGAGKPESEKLSKLREKRESELAKVREGFEEFLEEINSVIQGRQSMLSPEDKEITDKLEDLKNRMETFLRTSLEGGRVPNFVEIFDRKPEQFYKAMRSVAPKTDREYYMCKFNNCRNTLSKIYSDLQGRNR